MLNYRLTALIRKEFIQLFRDKRMLALILVIPLVQMFLLGYAATNDVGDIPLAVFDQDKSPDSRALLDAFDSAGYFKIAYSVQSNSEIQSLIEKGAAKAAIIIPPDYSRRLSQNSAQVSFILDGSDPSIASPSLSAAQLIGQSHATKILADKFRKTGLGFTLQPPVEMRTTVWYNPDMISAYFMIPGVIATVVAVSTGLLLARVMF